MVPFAPAPIRCRSSLHVLRYALLAAACWPAGCNPSPAAWAEPARAAANAARVDAGTPAAADRSPEPKQALPTPPRLPHSARLACGKDSDCAIVPPRPCMCPVCGTAWHEVLSKRELGKLEASWAKKRCVQKPCPTCESRLLGTRAVCRAGQCTVQ
jgi:hypothetical protein